MEGGKAGKRRCPRASTGDGQAHPPRINCLSSDSEDDGFGGQDVPTTDVAGPSQTLEPDDAFCSSVVKKILPALMQALGAEKVRKAPVSLHDNDTSTSSEDGMDYVPQVHSHAPISGASSPAGLQASQVAPQVNVGASHSSAEEFVGFPVVNDRHVTVGHNLGAVFVTDEANGSPVTEALVQDSRSFLRMVLVD